MFSTTKTTYNRLTQILMLTLLSTVVACNSSSPKDEGDPTIEPERVLEDGTILLGLPKNKSKSLFNSDSASSSEQYIRNYLIKNYGQVIEYDDYAVLESADVAVAAPETDGAATKTSTTNTIENNVDEADLIKTFSENDQDYLVTITQPERNYFYAEDIAEVENYKQNNSVAQLNLFTIDATPSSSLLTTATLHADAYHVSGIYSYQNPLSSDLRISQIITQTSLRQSPEDWSDYQSWSYGRTGIESVQLTSQALTNMWSIVFDGHLLDSRRIDNYLYVALRHYQGIEGLETVYNYNEKDNNATIAKNIEIIEQLDFKNLVPNVTITKDNDSNTSPVFDLASCQLPNNDDRFASGSVMFNYVAKIDLISGSIDSVQCILSEINQIYMNEESLFLIDANHWSEQTSRLHRFTLADLSYDTSLNVDGTLGWRSAQFRIKELTDGTVVLITSKPEFENQSWCCWFNNDWIHKLQLFQKDENQDYTKIAELPNESQPDNDDTPQSLGKAGEDIYGVRIDENSVKVVTFQQTDPLYVFDITDRSKPTYAGELADSGFSAYLHSFDDLILGIGFDANEWGNRQGIKVELYKADTSAENGIISLDEYNFGTSANTPVESDHHAFSYLDINESETRIAIPTTVYQDYQWDYTGLLLFTLDKESESLSFDGSLKTTITDYWGASSSWSDRSVIQHSEQGSAIHYIHHGEVISVLWSSVAE